MFDFLTGPAAVGRQTAPVEILARLVLAMALGFVVAWTYRRTRAASAIIPSFAATLVLLSILIAMVTQVIGDNVARAFSLVGALSIVRFRTVVRDTQDTAFVIFAVVVGMAVGANDPWVAGIGICVVAVAAHLLKTGPAAPGAGLAVYLLRLRLAPGSDPDLLLGRLLDERLEARRLQAIGTTKHGALLSVAYEAQLRPGCTPDELVHALFGVEGVQGVDLQRGVPPQEH